MLSCLLTTVPVWVQQTDAGAEMQKQQQVESPSWWTYECRLYTPCLKKNDNDVAHYNFNAH